MITAQTVRHEALMWLQFFVKYIPGRIGCTIRNLAYPYKCGAGVTVWDDVHIDKPRLLSLGDNVSINRGTIINAGGGVQIGDDVLVGPRVTIYSQNHRIVESSLIRLQGYDMRPVVIGRNVWIGAGAIVLPGVSIGENTVVAAGSVVTSDCPGNVVMAGNPARLIRHRDAQQE